MSKQPEVYRFESWLERQMLRDDVVGEYARAASGEGMGGRVSAYLAMQEAAHSAHEEFDEYLRGLPVKGTRRTYKLEEVAGFAGQSEEGAVVVADADDLADARLVLCVAAARRKRVREELGMDTLASPDVAVFASEALADVYLYRLRRKGLVDDALRVVALPGDPVEHAIFYDRTGLSGVSFCHCRSRRDFQKAYNMIDRSSYFGLHGYVLNELRKRDTAWRHELGGFYDTGSDHLSYDRGVKVEWSVEEIAETEAETRARLARERQELIEGRIARFFGRSDGEWVTIEGVEDAARVMELIDRDRELYEALYLADDEGHTLAANYLRAPTPSDHRGRTPRDLVRVSDTFDAAPGVTVASPQELFEFFEENAIRHTAVVERHAVRYLRSPSPIRYL